MEINVIGIFLVIVFSCLAWYANASLNTVPVLNKIVSVLIVVVGVLLLLQNLGLMGSMNTHISVH